MFEIESLEFKADRRLGALVAFDDVGKPVAVVAGILVGVLRGDAATDGDVAASSNTKITFSSASLKGDRVELVSDGTGWYVKAFAQNYAAITFDN